MLVARTDIIYVRSQKYKLSREPNFCYYRLNITPTLHEPQTELDFIRNAAQCLTVFVHDKKRTPDRTCIRNFVPMANIYQNTRKRMSNVDGFATIEHKCKTEIEFHYRKCS